MPNVFSKNQKINVIEYGASNISVDVSLSSVKASIESFTSQLFKR